MGLLDGIKNAFFEEVPDTEKSKSEQQNSVPSLNAINAQPTTQNFTQQPVTQASGNVQPQEFDKFTKHFEELFDKANLPGPDYFEFMKMTTAMNTLTDDIKYPAVFSALKVQGLSKESLLSTANQYIGVLEEDKKQFSTALDTKVASAISAKKNELVSKTNLITQKEELIKQLQTEIIKENADIITMTAEIQSDEKRLSDKNSTYAAALDAKKNMILTDIQKITTLIS